MTQIAFSNYGRFAVFVEFFDNQYAAIYLDTNYVEPSATAETLNSSNSPASSISLTVETTGNSTEAVEQEMERIKSALAEAKSSVETMEVIAIISTVALGAAVLAGLVAYILKVNSFQSTPTKEDVVPRATSSKLVQENPSTDELWEGRQESGMKGHEGGSKSNLPLGA